MEERESIEYFHALCGLGVAVSYLVRLLRLRSLQLILTYLSVDMKMIIKPFSRLSRQIKIQRSGINPEYKYTFNIHLKI
jgi:hypothetical protein